MSNLGGYLYGIIAAAVICSVIMSIAPKAKATKSLLGMLCGLFLLLSLLKPIKNIDFTNITNLENILEIDSNAIVEQGIESSSHSLREVIKEECEAYVVEKATQMGATISVDIQIAEGNTPVPTDATITGAISPYAKERLMDVLTEDLNIPKERLRWT